jgi:hypothetical protein
LAISSAKTLGQQAAAKAVMAKNAAVSMGKSVASSKFGQSVATAARSAAATSADITRKAADVVINAPKPGGLFSKVGGWFKSAGNAVTNVAGKIKSGAKFVGNAAVKVAGKAVSAYKAANKAVANAISAAATKVVDLTKSAGRAIGKGVLKIPFIAKALKSPFATKLIGTLAKFAAKGGLKVLGWPLMIGWALYDAYAGWRDAAKKLNKPEEEVTTSDKVACAVAGLINSLTLDLGPMVAELLGAEKNGLEKWLAGLFGGSPDDKPADGVKDSNKLKFATGYVGEYIDANGGIDKALKSKSISEFERDVKKYVSSHPEVKKSGAMSRRSEIMKAGMKAKAAYAEAFGISGQFSIKMGELIDPNTGEPVKRDGVKAAPSKETGTADVGKVAAAGVAATAAATGGANKGPLTNSSGDKVSDAATAALSKGKDDPAAAGKISKPKQKFDPFDAHDEHYGRKLFDKYIESIGGLDKVVEKHPGGPSEFSSSVRSFVNKELKGKGTLYKRTRAKAASELAWKTWKTLQNDGKPEQESDVPSGQKELNEAKSAAKAVSAPAQAAGGAAAAGKIPAVKPDGGKPSRNKWVSRYIEEKGGIDEAVKGKTAMQFRQDVVAWMRKQPEFKELSTTRRKGQIMWAETHAREAYARAQGVKGDFKLKEVGGTLIDPTTGETVSRDTSASIKKTDVVPTSSSQPTTQKELNDAKSAAKSAQQSSQIGPTVEAAKREEAKAAREDRLISTLENYSSVLGKFTGCFSKDGLQVAGMDMLTAVTASRASGSGSTQVINNNNTVVREANEGLDLRKKQW